jgi:hypothetical protein
MSAEVKWTDKKTALAEIIYSIRKEKCIYAGNIEIETDVQQQLDLQIISDLFQ